MTVRVEPRMRKTLDGIADALDRDRTYVVNQALEAYVEIHKWQLDHIKQGLAEADARDFVSDVEVQRRIGRLRRK